MFSTLRRIANQAVTQAPKLRRGFAGGHGHGHDDHHHFHPFNIPGKVNNLDHVYGGSTYRLPYDFQPPSVGFTVSMTVVLLGVFFFPMWLAVYEDNKLAAFEEKIAAAKAAKGITE